MCFEQLGKQAQRLWAAQTRNSELNVLINDTARVAKDDRAQEITSASLELGSALSGQAKGLHHIVIVGGGAGGLELATLLGDKLGKRGKA